MNENMIENVNIMERAILGSIRAYRDGKISTALLQIFLDDAVNILEGNNLIFES